jgi:hypothetical protein
MDDKFCKGCTSSVHISDDEIKKIFGSEVKVKNVKLVSEELYKNRLDICKNCDAFVYNTTCKYCGCLIEIKAKLSASKCPFPYNPKW